MASPSTIAALRRLEIFAFPPALVLLIAHGFASGHPFPVLGLVPLAASAILAIAVRHRDVVAPCGTRVQTLSDTAIFWSDFLLAACHLAFLAPSWKSLTYVYPDPLIALGAYCTTFMTFDLGVHLFIILTQARRLFVSRRSCSCPHCPHCRTTVNTGHISPTVSEYALLGGDDDESKSEIVAPDVERGIAKDSV